MTEVVVVGGGVAGAAAAARLAADGREVLVLEREVEYTDRVRGEGMVPWGLEAARALGLADAVLQAPGASCMTALVAYDELVAIDDAQRRARSLAEVLPGVPGLVAVGHPELRQALAAAAAAAGAVVVRGVEHVEVYPGPAPEVHYTLDGARHRVGPRLVVGADGKESVVRRALDVELCSTTPTMMLTGMLVDDGGVWDRSAVTIGVHGENQLYVFPRVGAVRLYVGRMIDAERLSGPDRSRRMLDAFRSANLPHAATLADARPIGPCATFPMTDTWTARPYGPGTVLVGDAAGWSNPVTGQGLAVAFRDAQVLTELLCERDAWSETTFDRYARERSDRMRRLRFASALTDLLMAQGVPDRADRKARMEALARRQPELLAALDAVHLGPWRISEEAFEPSILTALAAA